MIKATWMTTVVLGVAVAAAAQGSGVVVTPHRTTEPSLGQAPVSEQMRIPVRGHITRGAPYSADTTTETTQTLADGNRIVRKAATRVYRDGEGRTREERINDLGVVTSISISDPVSGETLMLNPETRTAYRSVVIIHITTSGPGGGLTASAGQAGLAYRIEEKTAALDAAKRLEFEGQTLLTVGEDASRAKVTKEDLGQQTIEGVLVTGTRTTSVIDAGAIGNQLPIRIVSEQWFSPDLQTLVLTRHSDPRTGETTFRLANIVRAEPDRSLFMLPPGYTLKESAIRREVR